MASPAVPTVHRFTRAEYHLLTGTGLFASTRVELLEGEVVEMAAKLSPHAYTINRLMYLLVERTAGSSLARVQDPIVLDDWSEPEPDLAVCDLAPDGYAACHPTAGQVQLVIEVADTSLAYDLTRKSLAYAAAGIPACWVVDLVRRCVHVLTDPDRPARLFRRQEVVPAEGSVGLAPGLEIAVADFLAPADPGPR